MALIRGQKGLFPCPRCLISDEEQGVPLASAPLRTTATTQDIINKAREERFAKDQEAILKGNGLRDVEVRLCLIFLFCIATIHGSLTERILEDRKFRPVCRVVFRSPPYTPWWRVSEASLGPRSRSSQGPG